MPEQSIGRVYEPLPLEARSNPSSTLPPASRSNDYLLCKAATTDYMEQLRSREDQEERNFGRLLKLLDDSIKRQSNTDRPRARVVIIDVDEIGLEVLGDTPWSDISVSQLRSPQKDNSTRVVILARDRTVFERGAVAYEDMIGVLGFDYDIEPAFFYSLLGYNSKEVSQAHYLEFICLTFSARIFPNCVNGGGPRIMVK